MWTYDAIIILLILFPGFAGRGIMETLTARRTQSNLLTIAEALGLTLLTYTAILFIHPALVDDVLTRFNHLYLTQTIDYYQALAKLILVGTVVAVLVGFLWALIINRGLFHRLLKRVTLSPRTARVSTWLDVFSDMHPRKVVVTLADGSRVRGQAEYYSSTQDEGELFLRDPQWANKDGSWYKGQCYGVLLTKNDSIKRVEFMFHENE